MVKKLKEIAIISWYEIIILQNYMAITILCCVGQARFMKQIMKQKTKFHNSTVQKLRVILKSVMKLIPLEVIIYVCNLDILPC